MAGHVGAVLRFRNGGLVLHLAESTTGLGVPRRRQLHQGQPKSGRRALRVERFGSLQFTRRVLKAARLEVRVGVGAQRQCEQNRIGALLLLHQPHRLPVGGGAERPVSCELIEPSQTEQILPGENDPLSEFSQARFGSHGRNALVRLM